ncbi:MAG: hypothetical protein AAF547_18210 [Actinomycetota bacterium]
MIDPDRFDATSIGLSKALRWAEANHLYGTIEVTGDLHDGRLTIIDGRILTGEEPPADRLAVLLENESGRCEIAPIHGLAEAHDRPSERIGEVLITAVRKMAATAAGRDLERQISELPEVELDPVPEVTDTTPTDVEAEEAARRRDEADRLRAEFFERRAHLRAPGASLGVAPQTAPAPAQTTSHSRSRNRSRNRTTETASRQRAGSAKIDRERTRSDDTRRRSAGRTQAQTKRARPERSNALRSLIRNLVPERQ